MNRRRPNEGPLPEPLAYFMTWPTYGSWLPGDGRGWVEYRQGWKPPDEFKYYQAAMMMTEGDCCLNSQERELVEETIRQLCKIRDWKLYAVNCRSNHVHVVVASVARPKEVLRQLKAWCTRRMKEREIARGVPADAVRQQWWAERGSARYLNDENSLEAATLYVRDAQDQPHEY